MPGPSALMAKTQIYQQEQALSVYFRDMLAEPRTQAQASTDQQPAQPDSINETAEPISPPADEAAPEMAPTGSPQPQTPLRLLLCELAGIKLALPVSELNNIVHWPQQGLNQFPNQADWQLGLLTEGEQQIEVIDISTALHGTSSNSQPRPRYIMLVDDRRRAITCDAIEQIVSLEPEAINWHGEADQHPWFSGEIAESMHHVIDLKALLAAIDSGNMA